MRSSLSVAVGNDDDFPTVLLVGIVGGSIKIVSTVVTPLISLAPIHAVLWFLLRVVFSSHRAAHNVSFQL